MKKRQLLITFAAMIALLASVSMAGALDTSPYLVGIWEDTAAITFTYYEIVNPTTKPLDVWAFMYFSDNSFVGCLKLTIAADRSATIAASYKGALVPYGAVKFFAFPQGSKKFDPNAVIGGFQRKGPAASWTPSLFTTEANLKAVTINSYTIGEFAQIQGISCDF
jgi:hypothetical protein